MATNLDRAFEAFATGVEERGPGVRLLSARLGLSNSNGHYWMHALIEAELVEECEGGYRLTAKGNRLRERLREAVA